MRAWVSTRLVAVAAALCAGALLAAPLTAVAQTEPTAPITAPAAPPAEPPAAPAAQPVVQPAAVQPAAAQPPAAPPADAPAAASTSGDGYVLGINDKLRILVFGEESLSGEFSVDSTGRVAMPFIGEVQAAGLTRAQFEDELERRMRAEQILLDPRVSIDLINFRPFYILGEVVRPGEYPSSSNLNVFNAVATAGGFTTLANQTRVMIKRVGETTEREYSLLSPVQVNPGDTIRVLKGAFYILGEVNRPGEYPFTEGMTIQKAVATAGGFTYRANQRTVVVTAQNSAEEKKVRLTANAPVEPGDTIRITERFF